MPDTWWPFGEKKTFFLESLIFNNFQRRTNILDQTSVQVWIFKRSKFQTQNLSFDCGSGVEC